MLKSLHPSFEILGYLDPATDEDLAALREHFGAVPEEYEKLMREVTELKLSHDGETYLRIWAPDGCIDQDEGYGIVRQIPGAFPVGDDGGGTVLLYMKGDEGFGLYLATYGDMRVRSAVWVAPSLEELLVNACGIYPGWLDRKCDRPQFEEYRTGAHLDKYNLPWRKGGAAGHASDEGGKDGKK